MTTNIPGAAGVVFVKSAGNGLAVAGFVIGLVGVVFGIIPLTFPVALAGGIIGLTLAAIGWHRAHKDPARGHRGLAVAGTILSVLAITLGVVGAVIVSQAVNKLDRDLHALDANYGSTP